MDLLYCDCNKLASPFCTDLKCINCCTNSNCIKHKHKLNNKHKHKNKIKKQKNNKKSKKKLTKLNNLNYLNYLNYPWINSDYTLEMLNEVKTILNDEIKKLIPDLTSSIMEYIDIVIKQDLWKNPKSRFISYNAKK